MREKYCKRRIMKMFSRIIEGKNKIRNDTNLHVTSIDEHQINFRY